MGSGKSKIQKNSTFYKTVVKDYKKRINEEANNKMEIIRPLLDRNEIDFSDWPYYTLTQADAEFILSHCGMNLNKLILNDSCNSKIMFAVTNYCQNLEELDFSLNNINEDDFSDAFKNMTKLKSLTIRPDSLFGKRERYLVNIDLILNIVPGDINKLFLGRTRLNCWLDTVKNPYPNHPLIFPQVLGRFQKLCYLMLGEYDIDNKAVMEISKVKSLIELEFISCKIEEGTSFKLNLPELESLTFEDMKNIDDCIINLPNELKNLKCLNLNNGRDVSADALKKISNLINLETLNLDMFREVDGDVFASIVKGCKKLKGLKISSCPKISRDDLLEISNLKNLECLKFAHTKNLNDDVIIDIANNCKTITDLSIVGCNNVSMLALNEVAKLENLEVLHLGDVHNAGDGMFKNMYKLKELFCTGCDNVTDTGIMRIIKNASNLENMLISGYGITSKTLVYAAEETKKRTNNIVLEVMTNERVFKDYQSLKCDPGNLIAMQSAYCYVV